jgi:hypothetical protein
MNNIAQVDRGARGPRAFSWVARTRAACSTLGLMLALPLTPPAHAAVGFRQVTSTHPVAVQRGTKVEVRLRSNFSLDETHAVLFHRPGIKMTYAEEKPVAAPLGARSAPGQPFRFKVEVPADQPPGMYEYRVATRQAVSSAAQLLVTDYPVVVEVEKENGTPQTAQAIKLPAAVCGACERVEDVDCFRFEGQAGQELTFEIFAQRVTDRIHNMVVRGPAIYLMDPILTLISPTGHVVAQNDNFHGGDSFIYCKLPVTGAYTLEVRDARYVGDPRYSYCVEISDRPYAHTAFPLAIERGRSASVELIGHMLGGVQPLRANVDPQDVLGPVRLRLSVPRGPTNPVQLVISPHPQIAETEPNNAPASGNAVNFPVGINGRLSKTDDVDSYSFTARKGQNLRLEVEARRHGSPLDSVLEVYDEKGKLLTEADDGDVFLGKDSRLFWTAPADGKYAVAVRDLHGRSGERFVYHLRIEPAEPDFELYGEYYYAMLAPGTRMIWFARIERRGGFDGPVTIETQDLPPGVTQTPVTIPPGMNHCAIILSAAKDAQIGATLPRVRGRAKIKDADGKEREIIRDGRVTCEQQNSGGGQARWPIDTQIVGVVKPMDLTSVVAMPEEITLAPGKSAEIKVRIERNSSYNAPVTLDAAFSYFGNVLGAQLPPGVTLSPKSKTRLSGKTLEGTLILDAAANALPVERLPIAAVAQVSISFSINTNYASNPVYLTVKRPEKR